jgi:thioredoxin 1
MGICLAFSMFHTQDSKELGKKIAKGKAVVLFYASWCPDCTRFMPTFDSLPKRTKLTLIKAQTDEDENPIWDDYKIASVPTVVLFNDGKEISRVAEKGGFVDGKALEKLLA